MNITFIGSGKVGSALAISLAKTGHKVTIAARNPKSDSVKAIQARNATLVPKPIPEAIAEADVIFLALPFGAIEEALRNAGKMTGKILIDCTNPVGPGLTHGLKSGMSGGEFVQQFVPGAKVVKGFNIYGYENFENNTYPGYGDLKPAMLIAGNDSSAKKLVSTLCEQLGWEPVDCGDISMSLQLEHMALLWIKIGRAQGRGPNFVWGLLKRQH